MNLINIESKEVAVVDLSKSPSIKETQEALDTFPDTNSEIEI